MEVKTIAAIGAGTMGRGIAYAAAVGGFETILQDVSEAALAKAPEWIREALEEGVRRSKVEPAMRDAAISRISTSRDVTEAIRDAELIIEAVPEELEMKSRIFAMFDEVAKPHAIFASNASSLSITEFTGAVRVRERRIGMHFLNPVPKMRLVEIVRAPQTSEETTRSCVEVAHRMHKETVIVHEAPGLITSRINALIGNQAFHMLETGVASGADVDNAVKLGLHHPMGPARNSWRKVPAECAVAEICGGRSSGRKTGRGVYDYNAHPSTNIPASDSGKGLS